MKIIFIDMDGTIIHNNQLLCPKDIEMLHKLREVGYLVAYNTGRTYGQAMEVIELFDLPYDYLVLGNGSNLYSLKEGNIYSYTLDTSIAIDIIKKSRELSLPSYYSDGTHVHVDAIKLTYHDDTDDSKIIKDQDYLAEIGKLDGVDLLSFQQLEEGTHLLEELKEYIDNKYKEEASAHINVQFLDVCASGCDKGRGIRYLKEKYPLLETYGIGDSFNDIPMFEASDHSYTFQRVSDTIKKHTDKQVDYVWQVVEEMLRES